MDNYFIAYTSNGQVWDERNFDVSTKGSKSQWLQLLDILKNDNITITNLQAVVGQTIYNLPSLSPHATFKSDIKVSSFNMRRRIDYTLTTGVQTIYLGVSCKINDTELIQWINTENGISYLEVR